MDQVFPITGTTYYYDGLPLHVVHPEPDEVRRVFLSGNGSEQPYWSAVWPSALALGEFIMGKKELFRGRSVWEPGAGLGLPSLLVSRFARKVVAGDISPQAVAMMRSSAEKNRIINLDAVEQDWNDLPLIQDGLVLLADVNYEPAVFESVAVMMKRLLSDRNILFLATPARISSGAFLELIGPWIRDRHDYTIAGKPVSVFTLASDRADDIVADHHAKNDL